jgi:hypothetical protein
MRPKPFCQTQGRIGARNTDQPIRATTTKLTSWRRSIALCAQETSKVVELITRSFVHCTDCR